MQQGDTERAKTLLQENMEVLRNWRRKETRHDAQEVPCSQPAGLPGDLRGGRLRSGDSSVGGKPGVGQGNGIQITLVGIMLSNLGHPALLQGDFECRGSLAKRPWRSPELWVVGELAPTASINQASLCWPG